MLALTASDRSSLSEVSPVTPTARAGSPSASRTEDAAGHGHQRATDGEVTAATK